jgi:hypothetical protein
MKPEIPESMRVELACWNNGKGIDLLSWVGCSGNFGLAVGYSEIFWPKFELRKGYILRSGMLDETIAGFENQRNSTPRSVEWVLNHLHIADIQTPYCEDGSKDKLVFLGNILQEIYRAKLAWQFPDRPCVVEFYTPDDPDDLIQYQISFWQRKNE